MEHKKSIIWKIWESGQTDSQYAGMLRTELVKEKS